MSADVRTGSVIAATAASFAMGVAVGALVVSRRRSSAQASTVSATALRAANQTATGTAGATVDSAAAASTSTAAGVSTARARLARRGADPELESVLAEEQFSRNRLFFGEAGQKRLENAFVVVVGLGGVGSHAAHMLARTGVGRLRLVDFDQVTLSSLNRHAVATRDDVGRPKVEVSAEHFADFNPACKVEPVVRMFKEDAAEELLAGQPDFVIDCIDDVNTKADLLLACHRRGLQVISCMGAGAKADPTRVLIGNVTDPVCDPLATKLHYALRCKLAGKGTDPEETPEYIDAVRNIEVIYSSEKPKAQLAALSQEQADNPDDFGAVEGFRLRVLPVLGTQPAIIGMGAASHVMCRIAEKSLKPRAVEGISLSYAHKLHQRLINREKKEFGTTGSTNMADQNEVTHLVEDVWRRQSAYSGKRYARDRQALTRFDRSKPALPYNLVLLTEREAELHDEETKETGTLPKALVGPDPRETDSVTTAASTGSNAPSKDRQMMPPRHVLRRVQHTLAELEAQWFSDERSSE